MVKKEVYIWKKTKLPPTFFWKGAGDVTPLPTDYSTKYLEGKWNIHHDIIGEYTTKHPEFDYFYQWMRYLFPNSKRTELFVHRGIPSELEPFFHEYINHAIEHQITPASLHEDKKVLKNFDKSFALHLHLMASDAAEKHDEENDFIDSGLYWYRRLYDNTYFQKTVSLDYWNREFDWRCKAIKKLSQELPQEEQISLLKDLICTLDIKLAYVCACRKQIKENVKHKELSPKKKSSQTIRSSFLHSYPIELIDDLRSTTHPSVQSSPNSRKTYVIPNPHLELANPKIQTLEDAFRLIQKGQLTEASREYVRSVYLNQVCTTPPKSIFQQACEDLENYLDMYTATPEDIQKYKQYIQHYCLRYYSGIWSYSPPLKDGFTPFPRNKPALERFLDNIIGSYCRTYSGSTNIARIIIPVYLSNPIEQCKSRYQSYVSKHFENGQLTSDLPLRADAYGINKDLQDLWIDGFLPPRTMQDNIFSKEDLDHICIFMEEHCSPAHELLVGSKLPWATKETFRKAWERFYKTQLDFTPSAVPAYCDILDIYLVYGMLVLRTWVSYRETVTMTTDLFDCLTEYINKKNSRSQKATCQDSAVTSEGLKQPGDDHSGTGTVRP